MSDQDRLRAIYKRCDVSNNATVNPITEDEFLALIAREVRLGQAKLLKKCYVDQGEIYVRLPNGFMEQYHYASELSKEDAL